MADWFKFYENDIDEMRLQWAIGEASEVLPVWIALLSEACRHKDGTLSGYCQDFELFALAKRINISVPKVNQSIELLIKIGYLERMPDKTLLIRKWHDKQSEYCQRKTRLQNQSGVDHHTKRTKKQENVPTLSEQCPDSVRQEERRGEEKRHIQKPAIVQTQSLYGFDVFWERYPKSSAKLTCQKIWKSFNFDKSTADKVNEALRLQLSNKELTKENCRFFPKPEKWLLGGCWEDKVQTNGSSSWKDAVVNP